MKNLKPLNTLISSPPSATLNGKVTLCHLLSSVVDRKSSERVFHAVCPHGGYEEDTVVLASLWQYSSTVQQCKSHFSAVEQDTFPWIQDADIFEVPQNSQKVIFGSDNSKDHLDSLFQFLKEDFPSLSDNENCSDSKASLQDRVIPTCWDSGPPQGTLIEEDLCDMSSTPGKEPMPVRTTFRARKPRKNRKARTKDQASQGEG